MVSTFGRGVYILDDYSALRYLNRDTVQKAALIFPVKDVPMYVEANPFGYPGRGSRGADLYTAPNPKPGAVFTYFVKDEVKSLKQKRIAAEKDKQAKNAEVDFPSYDELKKEAAQPDPYLLFTITDEAGNVVRKIKTSIARGVQRLVWDLRYQPFEPVSLTPFDDTYQWIQAAQGYMVLPGTYRVGLQKFEDGKFSELVPPQTFRTVPLNNDLIAAGDKAALDAFNKKLAELSRAVSGANAYVKELSDKIPFLKEAALNTPRLTTGTYEQVLGLQTQLEAISRKLTGDNLRSLYEGVAPPSLKGRIDMIARSLWNTTGAPTQTFIASYQVAADAFESILKELGTLKAGVEQVETTLERSKAPYTPGRLPEWKKE